MTSIFGDMAEISETDNRMQLPQPLCCAQHVSFLVFVDGNPEWPFNINSCYFGLIEFSTRETYSLQHSLCKAAPFLTHQADGEWRLLNRSRQSKHVLPRRILLIAVQARPCFRNSMRVLSSYVVHVLGLQFLWCWPNSLSARGGFCRFRRAFSLNSCLVPQCVCGGAPTLSSVRDGP